MARYCEREDWADVVPVPQQDGGPQPLAAIAYSEEYSEAMSYLRAVMAADEQSERVLELTQHVISMNPSHYTVWLYRAQTVFGLHKELHEELRWLNDVSTRHLKNYQIWLVPASNDRPDVRNHRQTIMNALDQLPCNELPFLRTVLDQDAKNYHVWSYRQWLVQHFKLWDVDLAIVDELLELDVRNNSAWNHRFFLLFTHDPPPTCIQQEIEYVQAKIALAPQNQSPWNYLRGIVERVGQALTVLEPVVREYAQWEPEDRVRSSHALDLMAELHAQKGEIQPAQQALDLLSSKYDPIRRNYWQYRKTLLVR